MPIGKLAKNPKSLLVIGLECPKARLCAIS
jgi:hypothetical protein